MSAPVMQCRQFSSSRGAESAFTRVCDALWRNPSLTIVCAPRISLALNPGYARCYACRAPVARKGRDSDKNSRGASQ